MDVEGTSTDQETVTPGGGRDSLILGTEVDCGSLKTRNPRQLEQEDSVRSDLAASLQLSILKDAINPGFFGELPGTVATFLAGVGAGVVLMSR